MSCAVDDETGKFIADPRYHFAHPYPATKVMFIPDKDCSRPDLLATTGDYLRIWHVGEEGVQLQKLLNNVRRRQASSCLYIASMEAMATPALNRLLPFPREGC